MRPKPNCLVASEMSLAASLSPSALMMAALRSYEVGNKQRAAFKERAHSRRHLQRCTRFPHTAPSGSSTGLQIPIRGAPNTYS